MIVLETTGDRNFDYWISMLSSESGRFYPSLSDWRANHSYEDDQFRGAGVIEGNTVLFRVPLADLGSPESIRVGVLAQRSISGDVQTEDFLPEAWRMENTAFLPLRAP